MLISYKVIELWEMFMNTRKKRPNGEENSLLHYHHNDSKWIYIYIYVSYS